MATPSQLARDSTEQVGHHEGGAQRAPSTWAARSRAAAPILRPALRWHAARDVGVSGQRTRGKTRQASGRPPERWRDETEQRADTRPACCAQQLSSLVHIGRRHQPRPNQERDWSSTPRAGSQRVATSPYIAHSPGSRGAGAPRRTARSLTSLPAFWDHRFGTETRLLTCGNWQDGNAHRRLVACAMRSAAADEAILGAVMLYWEAWRER